MLRRKRQEPVEETEVPRIRTYEERHAESLHEFAADAAFYGSIFERAEETGNAEAATRRFSVPVL